MTRIATSAVLCMLIAGQAWVPQSVTLYDCALHGEIHDACCGADEQAEEHAGGCCHTDEPVSSDLTVSTAECCRPEVFAVRTDQATTHAADAPAPDSAHEVTAELLLPQPRASMPPPAAALHLAQPTSNVRLHLQLCVFLT